MNNVYYDLDPYGLKIKNFESIFTKFGLPDIVVEIGCYYGKTTSELVQRIAPYNNKLTYYAIDPYSTSAEINESMEEIFNLFKTNLEKFPWKKNVTFLRNTSTEALINLYNNKIKPQLIYIDGDHTASTVLNDLVLSFEVLQKGGIIVCDDSVDWKYTDKNGISDPQMSPRMAVESFIMCNWSKIKIFPLLHAPQTAFIKL